jgi:hypothetical protein
MVVDSMGEPFVKYYEGKSPSASDSFAYKVESRWVSKEFPFPCIMASLAINSTDGIHAVYRHNNQLGYAYRNESGWNKDLVYATESASQVFASVDIDPDTLSLRSKGRFVTAYIEMEGADVGDIDASSIRLNDIVSPVLDGRYGFVASEDSYIVDHDENGLQERMVKFWRTEVQAILDVGTFVTITVSGLLDNGTPFKGTDIIRVIDTAKLNQPNLVGIYIGDSSVLWRPVAYEVQNLGKADSRREVAVNRGGNTTELRSLAHSTSDCSFTTTLSLGRAVTNSHPFSMYFSISTIGTTF